MDAIHFEQTITADGILTVPQLRAGDEVIVTLQVKRPATGKPRMIGWAKGKVKLLPGFDDPIPGMEEYS